MKTNRQIFSNFLGAQAREEVRHTFAPSGVRACITSVLPVDLLEADFACPSTLATLVRAAQERIEALRGGYLRLASLIANETNELNVLALRSKAALESAPFLIGSQHLIHSMCGSWNNESRYALATLRIHAADLGVGQPRASRICRYQELLRQHSLADAGEDLLNTADDLRISDGAFNFAAPLVILGHFPESLTGEILGVNLYLRQCGLLPSLEFVADNDLYAMQYLDLRRDPSGSATDLLELAEIAVREFLGDVTEGKHTAVRQGYHWARRQAEAMCQAMLAVLERWMDPREAAQQLVSRRRLDACQYHEKVRLNSVSMQSLLKDDGALLFLDHLAASAFVRAGKPESSPLLASLISPHGKMFRIFNSYDVAVLHRWISGLPYADAPLSPAVHHMWKDDEAFAGAAGLTEYRIEAQTLVPGIKARQAYPRLLHEELTLAEETYARQYVVRWLARAARNVANGKCPLPQEWRPGALRQWLQCQHEASNKAFDHEDDLPSKESVVADVLSLAPLTMIDGAWLAGFAHPAVASSGYGCKLFETFHDELGNGIETQNHPVIYRNLLRAVHGELPATADSEYSNASCFSDKDFELPVFWLAIGRYPLTYCPEILGLNLAMELSGVGGGYRRTHKALVAYGYPTMFVDLHNSIDNISSGHTAWAAASLDAYLSTFPRSDSAAVWARVRNGFAALNLHKEQTMLDKIREKLEAML